MNSQTVLPSLNIKSESKAAGFWIRFVASFLDFIFFGLGLLIPLIILSINLRKFLAPQAFLIYKIIQNLTLIITSFFYKAWFNKNKGGTPGKMLLGLKLIEINTGRFARYKTTLLRSLVLDFFPAIVGFIFIFIDTKTYPHMLSLNLFSYIPILICSFIVVIRKDKRGLHDLIAGTQVIKIK